VQGVLGGFILQLLLLTDLSQVMKNYLSQQFSRALESVLCSWVCRAWIVFALLIGATVQAQTVASGSINSNTTWQAAQGPYVITSDLIIQNNAVLTIEAGTQIFMSAGASVIVNGGAVSANGTAAAPIRVQSDKLRLSQTPAAGDWNKWIFNASGIPSNLTYVQIEHGKGLEVNSVLLNINSSIIRNHQGAAITQNLSASLLGAGNSAVSNQTNAVVVPAGDIAANVLWGLKGIPYLVNGTVSVGASPQITSLNPNSIQSGETLSAVVTGNRLLGATQAQFSGTGLAVQIQLGASDTQVPVLITSTVGISGEYLLTLLTDAGEARAAIPFSVIRPQPKITTITPATTYTNRGSMQLTITGSNFLTSTIATLDDTALSTSFVSSAQLQAIVPSQSSAGTRSIKLRTPDSLNPGSNLISNALNLVVNTPKAALDPNPVSMIDATTQPVIVTLPFAAPAGGVQFFLESAAPLVASVPASVSISQGAQSASFNIQAASVGKSTVTLSASGWASTVLPVTVIEPPRRLDLTPITSPLVGVVVGTTTQAPSTATYGPVISDRIGVVVGSAITQVSPKVAVVGTTSTISMQGFGLTDVVAVGVIPSGSVSFAAPVISQDGKALSVAISVQESAAKGGRRLWVSTANSSLTFVNPEDAAFLIAAPSPVLQSVSPQVIVAGQPALKLTVRGINMRDIVGVRFEPAQGISAVGGFTANAEGTLLEFNVQADASAISGPRVVIVQTAGGESSAVAVAGNTLQVARQIGNNFAAITSALVGVQVGSSIPDPVTITYGPVISSAVGVLVGTTTVAEQTATFGPIASPAVGVLVGGVATQMSPKAGVIGTTQTLVITGSGLNAVSSASFVINTGLTVLNIASNPEGTQLTVNMAIAADAPKSQRRLVLLTSSGSISFSDPTEALFLVAAPAPTLISVSPQTIVAGQAATKLTVRGVNFRDVAGVRFEPAANLSVVGAPTANLDGTILEVNVVADANAVSGQRTLIVMTAGGESSALPTPANTFQVARVVGNDLQAITSPLVGVLVGSAAIAATDTAIAQAQVGVIVGAAATGMQPHGATKGSSGQIQISGIGLSSLANGTITLTNSSITSTGVTLGAATSNAEGTLLSIPYSIAVGAPSAGYKLNLVSSDGVVLFTPVHRNSFAVIDEPVINSVSPTVIQRGKAYTIEVRGAQLQNVQGITLENAQGAIPGITYEAGAPVFATDGLGQKLSIRILLDPATSLGTAVVRINHAGGASSAQATTANTINIVNP
jgi:IPT/TIG domain